MTGHGDGHCQLDGLSVLAEVRTINNRYLKLSVRSNKSYNSLDSRIESLVRKYVKRGTINVNLKIDRDVSADDFRLNETVLLGYWKQLENIANKEGLSSLRIDNLLELPGVVEEGGSVRQKLDDDWPAIEGALKIALENLSSMRRDEGQAMADDLKSNCDAIGTTSEEIQTRAPLVVEAYQGRLTDRINKLLEDFEVKIEPADVVKEIGIFSDRCDISEELVRLKSHLQQFDTIMASNESAGRKLDFLTQELFRETNTIGSKANDAEIAKRVIEIKTCIERIREMVQNVE